MEKNHVLTRLKEVKEASAQRKFKQSVDLIINLKGLDLKKTDNHIDFYVTLHHRYGRKVKVCALVGAELMEEAKRVCDKALLADDFKKLSPKDIKKLAREYDYFVAQANIMPQVATTFGRVLGPRGKMPNPKAGCVVPPKAQLKPLYDRLQKTLRVSAKKDPVIHLIVGREDQGEDEVADNISFVYNQIVHHLPQEENNIKNGLVKLTMSKPVVL